MSTIGLGFIFRDDKQTVGDMLDSMLPVVDQVVAVDTGAADGSLGVVKRALRSWDKTGKRWKVVPFKWIGDFAAARQVGWDLLETEWGVWADADDIVDGAPILRQIAENAPANVGAFVFDYDYAQAPNGACVCTLRRERLIRQPASWRWVSPVHEVLLPPGPCEYGFSPQPVWRHRKQPRPDQISRNIDIIKRHLDEAAEQGVDPDPRMAVYYGTELAGRGKHEEAIEAYDRYFEIANWGEEKHQALHRKADSLRALGLLDEAIAVESFAITHAEEHEVEEWADHFFGIGESLQAKGHYQAAARWFERGLALGMPQSNMILNPRDYDFAPLANLMQCFAAMSQFDKALEFGQRAWQILPDPQVAQTMRFIAQARQKRIAADSTVSYLESLVRYDENEKALRALRTIPYAALDDPRVMQLRHHIRAALGHVDSHEEYGKLYETNREHRNPDQFVEDASVRLSRATMVVQVLRQMRGLPAVDLSDLMLSPGMGEEEYERRAAEAKTRLAADDIGDLRYLDAGCNDGWLGAHVEHALRLAVADGIDLNQQAIDAAIDRAKRFDLKGEYRQGFIEDSPIAFGEERYDAISCFEVFEHLVDPDEVFDQLERCLKPGGMMLVSTPAGAYEAGLIEDWQQNNEKQHLRAVTPTDFARFGMRRGELDQMIVGGEGVQTICYTPKPKKGRIVFWVGPGWEPWSPLDIDGRGLGGSETAVVKMADLLSKAGWFVEVFGGFTAVGPIGQVLYRNTWEFDPEEHSDVFVAVRAPMIIDERPNASKTVLWLHDAAAAGTLADRADKFDHILCLTEAHADSIATIENISRDRIELTRNGIDVNRHEDGSDGFVDRAPRVLYSSSPDRGLETLLEVWPSIRERVPDAELRVFYGFEVFDRIHASNHQMLMWKKQLVDRMASLDGVEFVGRVDQKRLAVEQCQARVWAYPYPFNNPTETSCITAMECMAAGLGIVATKSGALPETIGDAGILISEGAGWKELFAICVAQMLTDEEHWTQYHDIALERAKYFGWEGVAKQWDALFQSVRVGK